MEKLTYPAWFNGPKGETEIFKAPEDVPTGWTSGAEKIAAEKSDKKPADKKPADKKPDEKPADTGTAEIDADGHVFDPELHTGTKTKAGLWRMKVGVKRPEPMQHDL